MDPPWQPPPFPTDWREDAFYTKFLGWDSKDDAFIDNIQRLYSQDPARCIFDASHPRFETQAALAEHYKTKHANDLTGKDNFDTVMTDPLAAAMFMQKFLSGMRSQLELEIKTRREIEAALKEVKAKLDGLEVERDAALDEADRIVSSLRADQSEALKECVNDKATLETMVDELRAENVRLEEELMLLTTEFLRIHDAEDVPSIPVSAQIKLQQDMTEMAEQLAPSDDDPPAPEPVPCDTEDLERQIRALEQRIAENETAREALVEAEAEIATLANTLADTELTLRAIRAELARQKETNVLLMSESADIESELTRLNALQAEVSKLKHQMADLGRQNEQLSAADQSQRDEVERLRTLVRTQEKVDLGLVQLRSENKHLQRALAACAQHTSSETKEALNEFLHKVGSDPLPEN